MKKYIFLAIVFISIIGCKSNNQKAHKSDINLTIDDIVFKLGESRENIINKCKTSKRFEFFVTPSKEDPLGILEETSSEFYLLEKTEKDKDRYIEIGRGEFENDRLCYMHKIVAKSKEEYKNILNIGRKDYSQKGIEIFNKLIDDLNLISDKIIIKTDLSEIDRFECTYNTIKYVLNGKQKNVNISFTNIRNGNIDEPILIIHIDSIQVIMLPLSNLNKEYYSLIISTLPPTKTNTSIYIQELRDDNVFKRSLIINIGGKKLLYNIIELEYYKYLELSEEIGNCMK